jgi:hypothetical protein
LSHCLEIIAQKKLVGKYIYIESNQAELIEELSNTYGFAIERSTSGGTTFSALVVSK